MNDSVFKHCNQSMDNALSAERYPSWEHLCPELQDIDFIHLGLLRCISQVGEFLSNRVFKTALENSANSEGKDFNTLYNETSANGVRDSSSFWDAASARLVNDHAGDFRLIMPNAPDGSIAIDTEIPALLDKNIQSGQKVNGLILFL